MSKILDGILSVDAFKEALKAKYREWYRVEYTDEEISRAVSQIYYAKDSILLRSATDSSVSSHSDNYGLYCGWYVNSVIDKIIAGECMLSVEFASTTNLLKNHFGTFEKNGFWKSFDKMFDKEFQDIYKGLVSELVSSNYNNFWFNQLTTNEKLSIVSFDFDKFEKLLDSWICSCNVSDVLNREISKEVDDNVNRCIKFINSLQKSEFGEILFLHYAHETEVYKTLLIEMKIKILWANGHLKQIFEVLTCIDGDSKECLKTIDALSDTLYYIRTIQGLETKLVNKAWIIENIDLICNVELIDGELRYKRSCINTYGKGTSLLLDFDRTQTLRYCLYGMYGDVINDVACPRLIPELPHIITLNNSN